MTGQAIRSIKAFKEWLYRTSGITNGRKNELKFTVTRFVRRLHVWSSYCSVKNNKVKNNKGGTGRRWEYPFTFHLLLVSGCQAPRRGDWWGRVACQKEKEPMETRTLSRILDTLGRRKSLTCRLIARFHQNERGETMKRHNDVERHNHSQKGHWKNLETTTDLLGVITTITSTTFLQEKRSKNSPPLKSRNLDSCYIFVVPVELYWNCCKCS